MKLAIEMFSMIIAITIGCILFASIISSNNQVCDARDFYNVVVNRIEDSNCNNEVINQCVEEAKEKGYVTTEFGRRRNIPELKSQNYMVRQFGSRAALNMPIQGTAADIMKIAMIDVNKKIEEKGLKTRLVLQIHDELLLEVPKEEIEAAIELLKNSMENATKLSVPLIAEVNEAEDWYGCK